MESKFHVQIIIPNGAMELWKQKHKISKIRQNRNKTQKKLTKINKTAAKKWKRYQKRIKTFGKLRQKIKLLSWAFMIIAPKT